MAELAGTLVALSVSDAPDRLKLGFPRREIDRALFTLCMAFIRAGARLAYSGDLRAGGYTQGIFEFLASAYGARGGRPFLYVIPEPVLRRTAYERLLATLAASRNIVEAEAVVGGQTVALSLRGSSLRVGDERVDNARAFAAWLDGRTAQATGRAYSAARKAVAKRAHARIAVGGKMGLLDNPDDRYEGDMPGVIEEAILTLEAGAIFIPLGAFGGATRDAAIALGLLPEACRTPRGPQTPAYSEALERLSALTGRMSEQVRLALAEVAGAEGAEQVARAAVRLIAEQRKGGIVA